MTGHGKWAKVKQGGVRGNFFPRRPREIAMTSKPGIVTPNSVSRLFQRHGRIIVSKEMASEDKLTESAPAAGAKSDGKSVFSNAEFSEAA